MPKGAKTILAEALDPLLPGFERNRWTWNRTRNDLVQVIEISGSKHGTGDMTVDWGVAPERWAALVYGEELPVYSSSHCAVFGRLGDFEGGDRWWDLQQVRTTLPPDMHSLLFEHLLPFLQRIDSPEQLLALLFWNLPGASPGIRGAAVGTAPWREPPLLRTDGPTFEQLPSEAPQSAGTATYTLRRSPAGAPPGAQAFAVPWSRGGNEYLKSSPIREAGTCRRSRL